MGDAVPIGSALSFARGAVVRLNGRGANMLVVRDFGDTVAVVCIEGDQAGAVRLREVSKEGLSVALDLDQEAPHD
ncbi:hypothetical protein [Asaia spathodeae]|uniref:Uncharacterized protein n=1 Tax=Asaia spathodeae TaxID=657016 RepID=A0ABX2P7M7_9PROT|nr:hypothetical protein [Asaia spathodeae]GBR19715.1 hypothetical protein AA105894_2379 [Asaia spathodeae NBRC 105894]